MFRTGKRIATRCYYVQTVTFCNAKQLLSINGTIALLTGKEKETHRQFLCGRMGYGGEVLLLQ